MRAMAFCRGSSTFRGSRLVYSNGILALAVIASAADHCLSCQRDTRLIPLYAIGVFLSFTLSQAGMARRWWKIGQLQPGSGDQGTGSVLRYEPSWRLRCSSTASARCARHGRHVIFATTKFRDGAWVVLILTPLLVMIFFSIHRHYNNLARRLSLAGFDGFPARQARHRVIMPISGVHQGTLEGLRYARLLSDDVTAVHVSIDPAETEKVQKKWVNWGEGTRLVILDSPYRLFVEPLLRYLEGIIDEQAAERDHHDRGAAVHSEQNMA